MDATVFNLDAIRARQRIRTRTERILSASIALDGLELALSATSFWVECAVALASFQTRLLSPHCSSNSK